MGIPKRISLRTLGASVVSLAGAAYLLHTPPAGAQSGSGGAGTVLTYNPASSVKLEQVIGDCDFEVQAKKGTCLPTTSRTVTRFNILGNGQGGSFEGNGKMYFLFGDTISGDKNEVNYHGHDPIATSTSTDPEAGLLLNFLTNSDGSPLFVLPPGLPMGPDDVPNAGISLSDGIYLLCNVGSDTSLENPQLNDYSVLVRFDENARTFTPGRTVSRLPGGHFIFTSLHASGSDVLMFGAGSYRASDIYLSKTPASSFATGAGTQYFAGLFNGQPTWSNSEASAVPVVQDNPLNGPAWPNDAPTVGNLSVVYSNDLALWLMTFDGGRQSSSTKSVYFTYAQQPWGPWAQPQLIFNDVRENAYGVYIHNPSLAPPGDGLAGPVIGPTNQADPDALAGGGFAPLMIERFIRVTGNTLKIYYNLSTWNPYTIVRMRAEFTISHPAGPPTLTPGTVANGATYFPGGLVPGSWAQVKGANLSGLTRIWSGPDFAYLPKALPTNLSGTEVKVNGLPAAVYFIDPNQVNFQVPEGVTGTASVQVMVNGVASNTVTGAASNNAPGIFPNIVKGVNYAGGVFTDGKYVGDPANGSLFRKARPGEAIQLYATGLVPTNSGIQGGSQNPRNVTVTVGNLTVPADFAGVVAAGEFQINFVVPQQYATLPEANYPITIAVAGVSSPMNINSVPMAPVVVPIQH